MMSKSLLYCTFQPHLETAQSHVVLSDMNWSCDPGNVNEINCFLFKFYTFLLCPSPLLVIDLFIKCIILWTILDRAYTLLPLLLLLTLWSLYRKGSKIYYKIPQNIVAVLVDNFVYCVCWVHLFILDINRNLESWMCIFSFTGMLECRNGFTYFNSPFLTRLNSWTQHHISDTDLGITCYCIREEIGDGAAFPPTDRSSNWGGGFFPHLGKLCLHLPAV